MGAGRAQGHWAGHWAAQLGQGTAPHPGGINFKTRLEQPGVVVSVPATTWESLRFFPTQPTVGFYEFINLSPFTAGF